MNFLYSRIKKHCRTENGICLEFFFSARGVEMQQSPLGMLRSLLNQLFNQDKNIRPRVREAFTEKCNAFGSHQHNWEWQPPELKILLSNAIITSAEQRPVTIFVDALDEAGEQSAVKVATYFHELHDRINSALTTAKICISCRHYPIIIIIIQLA
jgi:ankyrin repeat domain-containing protein 50